MRPASRIAVAIAACLAAPPAPAQIAPGPWAFSTIDTEVFVTESAQVLEGYEAVTGQTQEIQHVAYAVDDAGQDFVFYATRSNANGGAWPSTWTVHPGALVCAEPSLAVADTGMPFVSCVSGGSVLVYWRTAAGSWTLGPADLAAPGARNGTIALRRNADGTLRAIHVAYQKQNASGSRVVAHRWCSTFPACTAVADWKADEVPFSSPNPARVGLVAIGSTSVQVAVPKGFEVWFMKWNAVGGWNSSSFQTPVLGSLAGAADEVAFERGPSGKIAAVTAGQSAYLIEWDPQQDYPYRYQKASGNDVVDTDHVGVQLTAAGLPVIAYQIDGAEDLALARRSAFGLWSREVVASQGSVGRWPRVDEDFDGQLLISYFDRTREWMRAVAGD